MYVGMCRGIYAGLGLGGISWVYVGICRNIYGVYGLGRLSWNGTVTHKKRRTA